jgi:hypothetical protein
MKKLNKPKQITSKHAIANIFGRQSGGRLIV